MQAGEPEIVFRHYLECVLESLELAGSYQEVLDYCDKAIGLFFDQGVTGAEAELAHVYQRQGAVLLKSGDREGAMRSLRKAVELGTAGDFSVALAKPCSAGWSADYRSTPGACWPSSSAPVTSTYVTIPSIGRGPSNCRTNIFSEYEPA